MARKGRKRPNPRSFEPEGPPSLTQSGGTSQLPYGRDDPPMAPEENPQGSILPEALSWPMANETGLGGQSSSESQAPLTVTDITPKSEDDQSSEALEINSDFTCPPADETIAEELELLQCSDGASIDIPIEIIQDYDLIVFACPYENSDREGLKLLVSRQVLSISSPIFKALLTLSEGVAENETGILQIYCNYPSALSIIFRLLHYDAPEDLFDIDFACFVQIGVLCEEYELHYALRPWMYIWSQKHVQYALDPGYEDWLFISKYFGAGEKLEELIELLVDQCSVISECGTYLLRREEKVSIKHWPQDILGKSYFSDKEGKNKIAGIQISQNYRHADSARHRL
ncbi:hypothetical protein TWF506_000059 [Arthrobotrys conoides]|uniref:BTB domain-containing protein n=1 Tax=Arthrobotrys conoides TaxID=74498 RepID=A0AAN8NYF9_9PEZI